jgi:hypothetical protein
MLCGIYCDFSYYRKKYTAQSIGSTRAYVFSTLTYGQLATNARASTKAAPPAQVPAL